MSDWGGQFGKDRGQQPAKQAKQPREAEQDSADDAWDLGLEEAGVARQKSRGKRKSGRRPRGVAAKDSNVVTLLLWGQASQGKTAYLWALGHQLMSSNKGGFRFGERLPSFQEHWFKLNDRLKKSWQRTARGKIESGVLDLFRVRRSRSSWGFRGVELELRSCDIAGELISHEAGFGGDAGVKAGLSQQVQAEFEKADANFVMARADLMLSDSEERTQQADFIRHQLSVVSKKGGRHQRTAVILTACDAIIDEHWRQRLGFADFGAGVDSSEERCSAAREFLVELTPKIGEVLDQFEDIEVFAVSSWGEEPEESGGVLKVANADPRYVEDPVWWVLEKEFSRRERAQRARRSRFLSSAAALLTVLFAVGVQRYVAPFVRAFEPVATTAALAPEIADLPTFVLDSQRSSSLPALFASAVSHARLGEEDLADQALDVLLQLDRGGYYYSRAFLEVSRIRVTRWRSNAEEAPSAAEEVAYVHGQAAAAGDSLDRYGRSVMRLRELLARVRAVGAPGDAATSAIYELLGADRLLAMQHGGDLMSSLWRQWVATGLDATELSRVLARLDDAVGLIARPEWLDLVRLALPELARVAFAEMERGDAGALVKLLQWRRREDLVHGIVQGGIRSAFMGSGLDRRGPSAALAREFALCFSQNSWVASALPGFLYEVLEVLVSRREEAAILKINHKVLTDVEAPPGLELAAAEWAAIHPRTRMDANRALTSLKDTYEQRLAQAMPAQILPLFERFSFVAGLLGRRFVALRKQASDQVAGMAIELLGRDDVLSALQPARVRFLVSSLSFDGSAPDPKLINALVSAVSAKADTVPPATLAAVVDIALRWLKQAEGPQDPVIADLVLSLATKLVERSFVDAPEFTGAYLGRLATSRFLRPLDSGQQDLLDETIGDIAAQLVKLGKWDGEASSGFARWLVQSPSLESVRRWIREESAIASALVTELTECLRRADEVQFALILLGLERLQPGAAARALIDDLRGGESVDESALVTGAAVIENVSARPDARGSVGTALFEACRSALEALFDESGAQRLSPARISAFEHLADALVATRDGGARLPERLVRRMQIEYLRLALGQVKGGQQDDAATSLSRALSWGAPTSSQLAEAATVLGDALDEALRSALALQVEGQELGSDLALVREQLCKAAFSNCDRVDDYADLLTQLTLCCEAWTGTPPRSPSLLSYLRDAANAFARSGEWRRLVDLWRVALQCEQVGLTPTGGIPRPDASLIRALVDSSAIATEDGWSADSASNALQDLRLLQGLEPALLAELATGIAELAVERYRAGLAGRGDPVSREFVCALVVGLLGSGVAPGVTCSGPLSEVFVIDLLQAGVDADLDAVVRSVPKADAESFAGRVAQRVGAVRMRAGDCRILLSAFARAARPELYRAAVRAMCTRPCPMSASVALEALVPLQNSVNWDVESAGDLFSWLRPTLEDELKRVSEMASPLEPLKTLASLLKVVQSINTGVGGQAEYPSLMAALGGVLERQLDRMEAESLRGVGESLRAFPELVVRVAAAQARVAALRGAWSEASAAVARISERELRERWDRFLDAAPRMVWLRVDGEDVLMRKDEVSVGEYRQFLTAISKTPALLNQLCVRSGLPAGLRVEDLEPGRTRADLQAPSMPVHKISWCGARLYAEWVGQDLPTLSAYKTAWGGARYPWGNAWEVANSNSAERYQNGRSPTLESVGKPPSAGSGGALAHLHGNVQEYTADTNGLRLVTVFGSSAWNAGRAVTRETCFDKFANTQARQERRMGVGFRTVMRLPAKD